MIVLNKLDKSRSIFVHKGAKNQYHSMEKAVQSIKDSKSTLLVYPEGSHSHMYKYRDSPPTLAPFKTGIFRAIYAVDVPVIPVVLPLEWTPGGESTVAIEILPLIYPTAYASVEAFTSEIYDVMLRRLMDNKNQTKAFRDHSPPNEHIVT
jgi:1-acyl-sn-glycerol-3-phosphate acyltransferase